MNPTASKYSCWLGLTVAVGVTSSTRADPPAAKSGAESMSLVAASRLGFQYEAADVKDLAPASTQPAAPIIFPDFSSTGPLFPYTVTLPEFSSSETRLKLTDREILTDKGRLELAQKRYITPLYRVTFGPLSQLATYYFYPLSIFGGWHPNEAEAMTLYREQERLRMLDEMDSLIRVETLGTPQEMKEFKKLRFEQYILTR